MITIEKTVTKKEIVDELMEIWRRCAATGMVETAIQVAKARDILIGIEELK